VPAAPAPEQIKDPKAILAASAPFYDFTNPALKPWHAKATYQIYDREGKSAGQGTWEYWWASPTLYRSTWTRGSSSISEWHTADGARSTQSTGDALHLFEMDLPGDLLSPFPAEGAPTPTRMERTNFPAGKAKMPCVRVLGAVQVTPFSQGPQEQALYTYCFDPKLPILLLKYRFANVTDSYGNVARLQDHYLSRSYVLKVDDRRLLEATVDAVTALDASDPALSPPPDAATSDAVPIHIPSHVMQGNRVKGPVPEYPEAAKSANLTGTVAIEATIGKDGKIHNLDVVSEPGQLLMDTASKAVSKWEYKPYLLNGNPVDVRTQIYVSFAMSP
jgi:TonB family protein